MVDGSEILGDSKVDSGPGPALLQGSLTGLFLRPPERGPYMDVLELSGGV